MEDWECQQTGVLEPHRLVVPDSEWLELPMVVQGMAQREQPEALLMVTAG